MRNKQKPMSDKYILALDQGTTSYRTVLFDIQGKIWGIAQKETEQIYPKHGWVEQNAEEIYQTQLETMHTVMRNNDLTYSDIACNIKSPKASRAVGAAVGKNPVSFVVPCHRALGKSGTLTGYHWGITRKQAMLGWEAGQLGMQ